MAVAAWPLEAIDRPALSSIECLARRWRSQDPDHAANRCTAPLVKGAAIDIEYIATSFATYGEARAEKRAISQRKSQ